MRTLIFTGEGKGKTTAALGMALRAAGHGMKVIIIQFIKNDSSIGEIAAIKKLPNIKIIQTGLGFVNSENSNEHHKAALEGLMRAEKEIKNYQMIILDEICVAIARNLIEEEKVIHLLKKINHDCCVVLTGTSATPNLIALADTVTEMRCIKHGHTNNYAAQKGVEF